MKNQFSSTIQDFTEKRKNKLDAALIKKLMSNVTGLDKIDWVGLPVF